MVDDGVATLFSIIFLIIGIILGYNIGKAVGNDRNLINPATYNLCISNCEVNKGLKYMDTKDYLCRCNNEALFEIKKTDNKE